MHRKVKAFAVIALLEGISYVLLLGIAMPLKYLYNLPMAVKIVGWAHGVFFMAYLAFLLLCWIEYRWSFMRVMKYFAASLLPVVPFYIERSLRKEYSIQPIN
jgi:integral membrane protein